MQGDINLIAIFFLILTIFGIYTKMELIRKIILVLLILTLYFVLATLFEPFRIPVLYDLLYMLIENLLKIINKIKEGLLWVCWH